MAGDLPIFERKWALSSALLTSSTGSHARISCARWQACTGESLATASRRRSETPRSSSVAIQSVPSRRTAPASGTRWGATHSVRSRSTAHAAVRSGTSPGTGRTLTRRPLGVRPTRRSWPASAASSTRSSSAGDSSPSRRSGDSESSNLTPLPGRAAGLATPPQSMSHANPARSEIWQARYGLIWYTDAWGGAA